MEDFSIFIAPMGIVIASILFLAIYIVKYKDPSDE
ncbi:cytochrome bd oxidase small subunit CydS [Paenibacillus dendrobii]